MITHLFFADDSLIYFKTTNDNTDMIKDSLNTYEKASGQVINFDKSAITFTRNVLQRNVQYIKDNLQLQVCQGHDLYLGLATFSVRSKRIQFGYFRDRAVKKLDDWKHIFFSEGGREVIIKSVIQAIPML